MSYHLNEAQLSIVTNALRVAADVYDTDALNARREAERLDLAGSDAQAIGVRRVADQFARQEREARELLDKIEGDE